MKHFFHNQYTELVFELNINHNQYTVSYTLNLYETNRRRKTTELDLVLIKYTATFLTLNNARVNRISSYPPGCRKNTQRRDYLARLG